MKKVIVLFVICLAFTFNMSGQKISSEQAKVLFEKAFTSLKNSDTTAFINLWSFDNTIPLGNKKAFTKEDAKDVFKELKVFLDTALITQMEIDEIEITGSNKELGAKYKIKAYFKYNKETNYIKAVGFRIDYINKKWVFRFHPEYTTGFRTKN